MSQLPHIGRRQIVSDRLQKGQVRERELGLAAPACEHHAAERARPRCERVDEARLPHPRLAADDHHAAVASQGGQQRVLERRQLGVAADQDRGEDAGQQHRQNRCVSLFLRSFRPGGSR